MAKTNKITAINKDPKIQTEEELEELLLAMLLPLIASKKLGKTAIIAMIEKISKIVKMITLAKISHQ
nr:hypothetical protein [Oenococcus oeni]